MSDMIEFSINDKKVKLSDQDGETPLIDYLHENHNLTGTKFSCGIGMCRACTVSIRSTSNGPLETALSCVTSLSSLNGAEIYTVESLGDENNLAPLQKEFLENFSFQCGYCTPGFLMAATALLDHLKNNPVAENELDTMIEEWIGGNLCRCTGYKRYIESIKKMALSTIR